MSVVCRSPHRVCNHGDADRRVSVLDVVVGERDVLGTDRDRRQVLAAGVPRPSFRFVNVMYAAPGCVTMRPSIVAGLAGSVLVTVNCAVADPPRERFSPLANVAPDWRQPVSPGPSAPTNATRLPPAAKRLRAARTAFARPDEPARRTTTSASSASATTVALHQISRVRMTIERSDRRRASGPGAPLKPPFSQNCRSLGRLP